MKKIAVLILGWLVPGLGTSFRRNTPGALPSWPCVLGMTAMGLWMSGRIYPFQTENPLTILAFFADIGNGLLYLISRFVSIGAGDLKLVTFEFGTAYIAGAGLLNYLIALDALRHRRGEERNDLPKPFHFHGRLCRARGRRPGPASAERAQGTMEIRDLPLPGHGRRAMLFGWLMYLFTL